MKKRNLFGWFAMVAMVIGTSCSSDEVVNDYSADNAIQFGTYLGRDAQTRAHIEDLTGLQGHGFGVYAYYTGQDNYDKVNSPANFMRDQKVEFSGGDWVYSPLKYWPNNTGDKISFFAYAPFNDGNIVVPDATVKGDPVLTFTVNADVTDQVDLLYSNENNLNKTHTSGTGVSEKIKFNFAHALSRLGFEIQCQPELVNGDKTGEDDDDTQGNGTLDAATLVTIKKVEVMGTFAKSGWLNLNGGTWTSGTTEYTTYEFTAAGGEFAITNVTTAEQTLNSNNGYLMFIPKNISDLQVRVTYDVTTTDSNLDGGKSVITNVITSDTFTVNFVQGKAYKFSLHLGLDDVDFTATMSAWEDSSDIAVNVPLN